jgi:hypothetical protein
MRGQRGQTLVDLTVAAALLLLLGAVLVTALTTAQTGAAATTRWAVAERTSRQLLGDLAAAIRSARPVGWCPTAAPGARYRTPANQCTHASEYSGTPTGALVPGGPLIYSSGTELWFWDFNDAATLVPALRAPDCIEAAVAPDGAVVIDRWPGTGTFTTPGCQGLNLPTDGRPPVASSAPAVSQFVGQLASNHDIFEVRENVVTIDATFSVRTGVGEASAVSYSVEEEAAVRGGIYAREQAWDA